MPVGHQPLALIVSRDTGDALSVQSCCQLCGVEAVICTRMDAGGDFRRASTVVGIPRLARRFPQASVIVVTLDVTFFDAVACRLDKGASTRVSVFPRPIWGWVLLDRLLRSRRSNPIAQRANDASMREK